MRNIIFALTATALVASAAMVGCSSSSTTTVPMKDMTTNGKPDLSELPPDMSVVKLGCVGYQTCILTCLNTPAGAGQPSPTFTSCEPMCNPLTKSGVAKTSMNTQAKEYFAWLGCTQTYCTTGGGESDAGTGVGACALSADMTMLIDAPGQPQGACSSCLNNAVAAAFQIDCKDPNSPDCNPKACDTQAAACMADLP